MTHPCPHWKAGYCELPAGELCQHKEYTDDDEWCGLEDPEWKDVEVPEDPEEE